MTHAAALRRGAYGVGAVTPDGAEVGVAVGVAVGAEPIVAVGAGTMADGIALATGAVGTGVVTTDAVGATTSAQQRKPVE